MNVSRLFLIVLSCAGLAACAPLRTANTSELESFATETVIAPEYASVELEDKTLAVIQPLPGVLDDTTGIQRYIVSDTLDLDAGMAAFARDQLASRLLRQAAFSLVGRPTLKPLPEHLMAPGEGTQFTFDGFVPDVVLFVDSLSIYRTGKKTRGQLMPGGYVPGLGCIPEPGSPCPPSVIGGENQVLLAGAMYLFWDNQEGRPIQNGRVVSRQTLDTDGRFQYEAIIRGLAQQMVAQGPFRGERR